MASHGVPRTGLAPRDEQAKRKEEEKIAKYRDLVDRVLKKIDAKDYSAESLELCTQLLKENPEYYTIWNFRRRILIAQWTEGLDLNETLVKELAFLVPLLQRYPKCYWIWNYRLWLLEKAKSASDETLSRSSARQIWEAELGLVSKMLSRDSRNFHGWSYRRTVVAGLESKELETKGSLVQQEFDYTTRMINTNLSNFSAWHNRSKLLPRLLREQEADADARRKMFDQELDLIHEALIDPADQSLWFYHSTLMTVLAPLDSAQSTLLDAGLSASEQLEYLRKEIDYVLEVLGDGAEDCKWVYLALMQLAAAYRRQDAEGRWPPNASADDYQKWTDKLQQLDPLREGRWKDMLRKEGQTA